MSNYPAKMAVISADFVIVEGGQQSACPQPYAYLNAFAILKVERMGSGFQFEEIRLVDETGTGSVRLLNALAAEMDADTSLAGYRLDRLIDAMVRVPCCDVQEADCKPALLRLQASLGNEVHDANWYCHDRHRSLADLARDYDLPAEWDRRSREVNANVLERMLSAKVQTVWLAIAHEWLTTDELRRATADYDQWRTANAIV